MVLTVGDGLRLMYGSRWGKEGLALSCSFDGDRITEEAWQVARELAGQGASEERILALATAYEVQGTVGGRIFCDLSTNPYEPEVADNEC